MTRVPVPINETYRLSVLRRLRDFRLELRTALDGITASLAAALDVKIALVSFVDADEQVFRASHGLNVAATPRDDAFCAHAIMGSEQLVVLDALKDPRFDDNPLVTGSPNIRFYAGAPLDVENARIGTLCAIDDRPRTAFSPKHAEILTQMAQAVSLLLEQQLRYGELLAQGEEAKSSANAAERDARAAKERFLRLLSHELRTPLNAVIGFSEMLHMMGDRTPKEKRSEYLQMIGDGGRRLLSTIDAMLEYSNIEQGTFELDETVFDLIKAIREAGLQAQAISGNDDKVLDLHLPEHPVEIVADRVHTINMISHVLEYAIGRCPAGEWVDLRLQDSEEGLVLEIRDRGQRISESDKVSMLSAFDHGSHDFLGDDSGLELGLPVSKLLAEAHGGRLILNDGDLEGMCASLVFPNHRRISRSLAV